MIESTFLIVPGVGVKKERTVWSSGIDKWNDFLSNDTVEGISSRLKIKSDTILTEAYEFLDNRDSRSLGNMLPKGEQWRLFDRFRDNATFLDIETDGLERDSLVTVVTIHSRKDTVTLVQNDDLNAETLSDALKDTSVLVTFNGSCFDIPVLRNSFPKVDLNMPHFDLRFGCRKVGYTGGLKCIERTLGIGRSDDIHDVDGEEAVALWKLWDRRGDRDALNRLIKYNRADTVNLENISKTIYGKLVTEYAGFGRYA
ncbi:MAG: ribonuclease H-like domain-containing protein [Candidatus Methanomethylophilaceae archaeon]